MFNVKKRSWCLINWKIHEYIYYSPSALRLEAGYYLKEVTMYEKQYEKVDASYGTDILRRLNTNLVGPTTHVSSKHQTWNPLIVKRLPQF